jgi:hypothetical protein
MDAALTGTVIPRGYPSYYYFDGNPKAGTLNTGGCNSLTAMFMGPGSSPG